MAPEEDVCSSCSAKFVDLKCAIMCIDCKKFFHGSCEGISDLRGFHMKRPTWKCSNCVKTGSSPLVQVSVCGVKRSKSNSGNVVEVDRHLIENLVSTVNGLKVSVDELKNQLASVQKENSNLHHMVRSLLNSDSSLSTGNFLYSSVAKTNQQSVNGSCTANTTNNSSSPFMFGNSDRSPGLHVTTRNLRRVEAIPPKLKPFTFSQVNDAVNEARKNVVDDVAAQESRSQLNNKDGWQDVDNRRRKRISKPVVIGTKITDSNDAENSTSKTSIILGTERRQWVYVGRIRAGTSADDMAKFVQTNFKTTDVKCFPLRTSNEICSFKIGVNESLMPELMKAENWPQHVAIREFVNFPRLTKKLASIPQNEKMDFQPPNKGDVKT